MQDLRQWGVMVEDTNGYPQHVSFMAAGAYEAEQYAKSVWGDRVRSIPYAIN
jgi:hypothetical protein